MPTTAAITSQLEAESQTPTDIASNRAKTTAITDAQKSTAAKPLLFILPPYLNKLFGLIIERSIFAVKYFKFYSSESLNL